MNYIDKKLVYEYTGFNFIQIEELDVFEFQAYLRDAVIYKYMQTEQGQEYLERCWIYQQTKPNRESLREKFGREV